MTSVDYSAHAVNPVVAGPAKAQASAAAAPSEGGFSFDDLIDIVNPLQHIPIVSTIYRAITGDQIKTFPKLAGDALYGGVEGLVGSMADTIFQKVTGKSVGDTVLAWVEEQFAPSSPDTGVASNAGASEVATAAPAPLGAANDTAPAPIVVSPAVFSPAVASAAAAPAPATPAVALNAIPQAPVAVAPATLNSVVVPGQDALFSALSRTGLDEDLVQRAAEAYRRTLGIVDSATSALH
jgi:hypothetical protein